MVLYVEGEAGRKRLVGKRLDGIFSITSPGHVPVGGQREAATPKDPLPPNLEPVSVSRVAAAAEEGEQVIFVFRLLGAAGLVASASGLMMCTGRA